mgnify:CR=1 FL=1
MTRKTGRKSSYDTVILPNKEKIVELLSEGYSERDVAKKIGVSYSTWKKYKNKMEAFSALILTTREKEIKELEKSMYIQALGFTKTVKKAMKLKVVEYDECTGKKKREEEKIEFYEEEIYIPPSQSAGAFLLKNWAKEKYSNNPAELQQKKEELEYKRTLEEW